MLSRQITHLALLPLLALACTSSDGDGEEGAAGSGANAGGSSAGGSSTGGTPSGAAPGSGASTGGAPDGGASTGGAPDGGAPDGGASTGGTPSGGAPDGGASTGGTPSGGAGSGSDVEDVCVESEAVGYPGDGNTCGFQGNPGIVDLPRLAMDEFNYNTFFTGEGYPSFDPDVGNTFNGGDWVSGFNGQGKGCGACLKVTGPNGSITAMVWEIADIGAVGPQGQPNNVHIENAHINDVRNGSGVGTDVTIQPVPCPINGNIQLKATIYNAQQTWYNAVFYTPYNHVYPIEKLEFRAEIHDEWYELYSDWTHRFRYENHGDMMRFPHDGNNTPVRFRLTSVHGDVIESGPIQMITLPASSGENTHDAFYDLGVQFAPRAVPPGACTVNRTCGNKQMDADETCELNEDGPVGCDTLGAGTGTAVCDPATCTWDTSGCSQ